jgi:hypothetical protein
MLATFIWLFNFFINYRKKLFRSKLSLARSPSMSSFNKFIVIWIFYLCILIVLSIATTLINGIAIYMHGADYVVSPINIYFLSPMYKIILPFKDFFIAISFVYLYFYQGNKKGGNVKGDQITLLSENLEDKKFNSTKNASLNNDNN